jgi:hypothetical protein
MFAAAESLDPGQRRAVIHFLTAVADAMSGDVPVPAPEPIAERAPNPGDAPDRGPEAGLPHGTA